MFTTLIISNILSSPAVPIIKDILKVYIPPRTNPSSHDMAVLEIPEIDMSDELRPICLPM